MSDEQLEFARQIQVERERARQLEEELATIKQLASDLQNQLDTYKPLAQQWMREHGPSREECERSLQDMLEHPEKLMDFADVIRELEQDAKNDQEGGHAA
jgi:hypothetical protein